MTHFRPNIDFIGANILARFHGIQPKMWPLERAQGKKSRWMTNNGLQTQHDHNGRAKTRGT